MGDVGQTYRTSRPVCRSKGSGDLFQNRHHHHAVRVGALAVVCYAPDVRCLAEFLLIDEHADDFYGNLGVSNRGDDHIFQLDRRVSNLADFVADNAARFDDAAKFEQGFRCETLPFVCA